MTGTLYPTLPQGFQRFSVEQLLIELAPILGLRGGRLHALLYMMKQTAPDDWTTPHREPVYFAPQDQTAEALNKTPRALYNDEAALEAAGLIEKRVKGNGARSPFGGCGIVFSRLIALVPDLLALKEQATRDRQHRKELRNRRSTYLRYVKRQIECLGDYPHLSGEARPILANFSSWPEASRLAAMPIDVLEAHVCDAQTLCNRLDDLLQSCRDSSGPPEENCCCFIQENNQDTSNVSCNANVDELSAGKPAHLSLIKAGPNGPEDCLENKHRGADVSHNTKFIAQITPERLYALASDDMRAYIEECQAGNSALREIHLIDAATRLIHPLGINHSAWMKAVNLMGDIGATLCVLLIDANRTHPTTPIRNPGGALRAMTDRFAQGKLNLTGSLIGLARRRGL
jgi:replication initiation protein RepC